jgi:hypothetical protein
VAAGAAVTGAVVAGAAVAGFTGGAVVGAGVVGFAPHAARRKDIKAIIETVRKTFLNIQASSHSPNRWVNISNKFRVLLELNSYFKSLFAQPPFTFL